MPLSICWRAATSEPAWWCWTSQWQWGALISLTDQVSGLAAAPDAFVDLLAGGNIGTRVVVLD